jgi:hypothetical protein
MTAAAFSEADLCAGFIAAATKDGKWRAYPETAGFDILLVRTSDGAQIGIEAKLTLNNKVLTQVLPDGGRWNAVEEGPDYRAVLVPRGKVQGGLCTICGWLGITVLMYEDLSAARYHASPINPSLPDERFSLTSGWHEWCPVRRCAVPDYVPDVAAGSSAPVALTVWKVKAIKIVLLLDERPVTRRDFKALQLDPKRWTDPHGGWLCPTPDGYVAGPRLPDFRAQHPVNFEQIRADMPKWRWDSPAKQEALL